MSQPAINIISRFILFFLLHVTAIHSSAQDTLAFTGRQADATKSSVFIGTQVPLQFTLGFEQGLSHRFSVRAQAGLITKPYSGFIVESMKAFGMDDYLARVIKKSFQRGSVFSLGPIYHFGKSYVGVYGQYMHLKGGGITPADALSIYFNRDFTAFDVNGIPAFEFSMQSNILNLGAMFGHRFQLGNPRLSLNGELGFSKIIGSKNSFSSNRRLIDQTRFAQDLYSEIDKDTRKAYMKHGYIPTINLYLAYSL